MKVLIGMTLKREFVIDVPDTWDEKQIMECAERDSGEMLVEVVDMLKYTPIRATLNVDKPENARTFIYRPKDDADGKLDENGFTFAGSAIPKTYR